MENPIRWTTMLGVASWCGSSIGVLLLNKQLLTGFGFKYPVFLTFCHMLAWAWLSYVAIGLARVVRMQAMKSMSQLAKVAALSVVFCFSVVCRNVSLMYIPVPFNQAIGATMPFFTAVFAYLMIKKREVWVTYATLVPVVVGVVVASGVPT